MRRNGGGESGSRFQRREMLRAFGALGAGLAIGPVVALAAPSNRRDELVKSRAVLTGRSGKFTILHTADIHAQLHTHHEVFYQNRRAVYTKRGGCGGVNTKM